MLKGETIPFILFRRIPNNLLSLETQKFREKIVFTSFKTIIQLWSLKLAYFYAKAGADDTSPPLFPG